MSRWCGRSTAPDTYPWATGYSSSARPYAASNRAVSGSSNPAAAHGRSHYDRRPFHRICIHHGRSAHRGRSRQHLISLAEAADRIDVSTRTLRRYIAAGRLTGYRVGPRLIKIDPTELAQLPTALATYRTL